MHWEPVQVPPLAMQQVRGVVHPPPPPGVPSTRTVWLALMPAALALMVALAARAGEPAVTVKVPRPPESATVDGTLAKLLVELSVALVGCAAAHAVTVPVAVAPEAIDDGDTLIVMLPFGSTW